MAAVYKIGISLVFAFNFPHLPAERGKRIQSLLILGGVAHHRVVTPSSLQHNDDKHSDMKTWDARSLLCTTQPHGDALCWGSSAGI